MTDIIECIREKRKSPKVLQQRFNSFISRHSDEIIFAVEGEDDITYYNTILFRLKEKHAIGFSCKGKDNVLNLRDIIHNSPEYNDLATYFFIDKDFDYLKGREPSPDLYCTPVYSFENILICDLSLRQLLIGEFHCNDENAHSDLEKIKSIYDARKQEFLDAIRYVNNVIFHLRTNGIQANSIEKDLKKFIRVNLDRVDLIVGKKEIHQLVGLADDSVLADFVENDEGFKKLDPEKDWRGKFIYAFFCIILSELKEDRGKRPPSVFASRKNMTFDPRNDIFRALSSLSPIPTCLREFMRGI
ncbi:DUF4435 domain-containing protein [Cronobacter dublinensis]|uniref:DUF4435 domain-containing protein n=1 Tax=Cronobacter dublinensis TaxID=413497 RepID=UPI00300E1D58